jgi:ATP-dependent DNA helicase RecQ
MGEYPVLKLTPAALPLLKGESPLMLARPRVKVIRAKEARAKRGRVATRDTMAVRGRPVASGAAVAGGVASRDARDEALFEELRALRKLIADRERLPAYVIFHDATLWEMATQRPTTPDEFLDVSGVGQAKLAKYGVEFLAVLGRRDAGEDAEDGGARGHL